jgi:glycosyltransferase involved in cell wall biosynthesis
MRLVMTLLVRNEADVLEANIEHHRHQGVDFFVITDNNSTDDTLQIIQRYVSSGLAQCIQEFDDNYCQAEWVTRMARQACANHQADWVIHCDADEFWVSSRPGGTLRSELQRVPAERNLLYTPRWNAVVTSELLQRRSGHLSVADVEWFDTTSTTMLGNPLPSKVAHRADAHVNVMQGNHDAQLSIPISIHQDHGLLILHFPCRSYEQYRDKIRLGGRAYSANPTLPLSVGHVWREEYRIYLSGRLKETFEGRLLSPEQLRVGIESFRYQTLPQAIATPNPGGVGSAAIHPISNSMLDMQALAPAAAVSGGTQLPSGRGIISLADDNYFVGFKLLALSIGDAIPITVFDLGLGSEAREWIDRYPHITIRPIPDSELISTIQQICGESPTRKSGKREWPLWICPSLILDSPYEEFFWFDADVIMLRGLEDMFTILQKQPFIVEENFAPHVTDNPAELYEYLPVGFPLSDTNRIRLNAGITGWIHGRDQHLMDAYNHPVVSTFLGKLFPRTNIRWWDQGCLIWALQQAGFTTDLLMDRRWNLCAKHSPLGSQLIDPTLSDSAIRQWIDEARRIETHAMNVHWNGQPLPWLR